MQVPQTPLLLVLEKNGWIWGVSYHMHLTCMELFAGTKGGFASLAGQLGQLAVKDVVADSTRAQQDGGLLQVGGSVQGPLSLSNLKGFATVAASGDGGMVAITGQVGPTNMAFLTSNGAWAGEALDRVTCPTRDSFGTLSTNQLNQGLCPCVHTAPRL